MSYRIRVRVMPRRGLLDPQGKAVESALKALQFTTASDVHVGKSIELTVAAPSLEAAKAEAKTMCERLLANPVMEDFEVEVETQ